MANLFNTLIQMYKTWSSMALQQKKIKLVLMYEMMIFICDGEIIKQYN